MKDKILLLNGSEIACTIIDTSGAVVKYSMKRNSKVYEADKYRIFSFTYGKSSEEIIVYELDTLSGNDFSQHEMRMFLYGESDAKKNYKVPLIFIGAAVIGAASAAVLPIFIAPIVPAVFVVYAGSRFVKINRNKIPNKFYLSEDAYVIGYDRAGRIKNVQKALLGTVIGLGAGFAVNQLFLQ